jgi:hypothetical protein
VRDRAANVAAYFAYSLLDGVEWADGRRPRFGIVRADINDAPKLRRYPKLSAYWLSTHFFRLAPEEVACLGESRVGMVAALLSRARYYYRVCNQTHTLTHTTPHTPITKKTDRDPVVRRAAAQGPAVGHRRARGRRGRAQPAVTY